MKNTKRKKLTKKQLKQLWEVVVQFVDDNHVSREEHFHQCDSTQVNVYDLIPEIASIVGFNKYPDQDVE